MTRGRIAVGAVVLVVLPALVGGVAGALLRYRPADVRLALAAT
ncbi:hypothetical protein ACWED2_12570 [Amycolatopsis sp. NPDC005003]